MRANDIARDIFANTSPRQLVLLLVGGLLNAVFVTMGFHGAFNFPWALAVPSTAMLIATQYVLIEESREGRMFGWTGKGLYLVFACIDILLAAAGLTAALGADALGQSFFENSVAAPVAAINAVNTNLTDFSAGMSAIAAHSTERRNEEVANGKTCAPSPRGEGPYSRLRDDDARINEEDAKYVAGLADRARGASRSITGEVASYRVAQHQVTINAIDKALSEAKMVAGDSRLAAIRTRLVERQRQVTAGRPDRVNPALLVRCPRDTELTKLLAQIIAVGAPVVPGGYDMPPVPDEHASVMGLIAAIGRGISGQGWHLGPWAFALVLSPVPDLLFLYGLWARRRSQDARKTVFGGLSATMGLPHEDLYRAFQSAEQDVRYVRLQAWHFVWQRWWMRAHGLAIPITDIVGCNLASALVDARIAFDGGLVFGTDLPDGAIGFDPNSRYRLFTLKPRVWSRLEADAVRAAILDPQSTPPTAASPMFRRAANHGEAA